MRQKLSQAAYVQYGYGQVEPNHLSAQVTGEIYAQYPAAKDINILENGMFVKRVLDANDEVVVDFDRDGSATSNDLLLVYNEVKVYNDHMMDCDFAMIKDNYVARLYSPAGGNMETVNNYGVQVRDADVVAGIHHSRYYGDIMYDETAKEDTAGKKASDILTDNYVIDSVANPFFIDKQFSKKMPEGTKMVPRLFATHVGDIFTTNTIDKDTVAVGDRLAVGVKGYLEVLESSDTPAATDMLWKAIKVYTMPDGQPGVKLMRIQ